MRKEQKNTLNKQSSLIRILTDEKVLILFSIFIIGLFMFLGITPVFASGTASTVIDTGFANLQSIVESVVTAVGTIMLLWGLFEWGISIQSPDGVQQSSAFKRIGGGIVMVVAPQLLTFFV